MTTELVPTKFARSLLHLVKERNYSVPRIVELAGIPFNPLDPGDAGYQDHIDALTYSRLYQQVLSVLQDESFGMPPGPQITPGAFRMLCYCILSCNTLGHAIRRIVEFYHIFFSQSSQLFLERADGVAAVGYGQRTWAYGSSTTVNAMDAYSLMSWHRFFGWLIGQPIPLLEVTFAASQPEHVIKYERVFGCPLLFDQPRNEFRFDSRYLGFQLVHTEQSVKEFLRTAPYQLLVMSHDTEGGVAHQVRALIGHDFSQGPPKFEKVAKALNMSGPTLRRRLRREGTTYQALKDDCRRDAAIAYLSRSELSVNAVAALMGFTDPSAFHRSFKKWTGLPPGEFRQREIGAEAV